MPGTNDVIGAGDGGQVARWDMSTGERVAGGRSSDPSILADLAVSPDGSLAAAYHPHSSVAVLFDTSTLRPIGRPLPAGDRPFIPDFTPDGRLLAINGVSNELTLWDVDADSWRETACELAGRNLTRDEWTEHLGADEPYRLTCPQWPPGE